MDRNAERTEHKRLHVPLQTRELRAREETDPAQGGCSRDTALPKQPGCI